MQQPEVGEADVLGDLLAAGKLDGIPYGEDIPRPRVGVTVQDLGPGMVRAVDLTNVAVGDLVSLKLGDSHAEMSLLGSLDELVAVVAVAARELARVKAERS